MFLFDGSGTKGSLTQVAVLMGAAIAALCIFVVGELKKKKAREGAGAPETVSAPLYVQRTAEEVSDGKES